MSRMVKESDLTEAQKNAINIAFDHYGEGKNTVIAGYAGTGKSTLVKFLIKKIVDYYGLKDSDITYAAFTGKASQVLTNKGCPALTLHKLMYDCHTDRYGDIVFELKENLPYKLIIVDECSMPPSDMVHDLEEFGIPIVYLGDPGQLPPIQKDFDNHLLDHPDVFLTEVLRQALDSPIIRLSMKIRNGESIDDFNFEEAKVIRKKDLPLEELRNADMILVGTNNMRKTMNKAMRSLLGKKGLIDNDEKIICTNNYWEHTGIEKSLTNGTVGILKNHMSNYVSMPKLPKVAVIQGDFISETGLKKYVKLDQKFLESEESSLTIAQKMKAKGKSDLPKEFTYAYAITGHKAQGSEWDNVIVFEENFPTGEEHKKWLYTCVTRAKKKVILVRG